MDNNFLRVISCEMEMPPQEHNFEDNTDYGCWGERGWGTMSYRKCSKCGLIEYSKFVKETGEEEDIDNLYRSNLSDSNK